MSRTYPMERHYNLYLTMWCGVFNKATRRLSYASAGHPPAILITGPDRAVAQVENLKAPGPPIGTTPDSVYPYRQINLQPFYLLFVFSDGTYDVVRADGSMLALELFVYLLVIR